VRLTQGAFSFLPDLTDAQIKGQVDYCIANGWAINIEWTDDPHPRNTYWELWGLPLFDIKDPAAIMYELAECRKANTTGYIKMNAFDASIGTESCVHSFIVQRPKYEPGFFVQRTETKGRNMQYTIVSHTAISTPRA
jgi:ribulose-bisphosphate carboxylase small chain